MVFLWIGPEAVLLLDLSIIKPGNLRVNEVRSKILTPLETTGGNSFSLEGFEKMLFTIQNFTQGDLHSTRGIQISFLGVYNSTTIIQSTKIIIKDKKNKRVINI